MNIKLFDLVSALSRAIDLVSPTLTDHHHRVAFIAMRIGNAVGLDVNMINDLILAGMLHDAGALSLNENLDEFYYDLNNPGHHSEVGYQLIKDYEPLRNVADIIRHHHVLWENGGGDFYHGRKVHLSSHILHIAERVGGLIDDKEEILGQMDMFHKLTEKNSGKIFKPELVDSFLSISQKESFWFDIISRQVSQKLGLFYTHNEITTEEQNLFEIARIFYQIIDFRSRFTTFHSSGVSISAEMLGLKMGLSLETCQKIRAAGWLHDLGKLAVPKEILEKPDKLTPHEFNVIKSHAYHTHNILKGISGLGEISDWAAFHHERPNGCGYPFRIKDHEISHESRIISVADVFTALTEDRPYRKGLSSEKTRTILKEMACDKALDADCISVLEKNYDEIDETRRQVQKDVGEKYQSIYSKG